jgi:acyl CoA:acetate/3-ketoacid CoA transferase
MPRNRMTFHDPRDELSPVTVEILKGDVLRFTQVDREGRTNVVTFSDRFDVRRGGFDVTARPTQPLKAEG